MSYSTYWSYLYSVALLNLCLVGECALAPGRPDPLKGVYGGAHEIPLPLMQICSMGRGRASAASANRGRVRVRPEVKGKGRE